MNGTTKRDIDELKSLAGLLACATRVTRMAESGRTEDVADLATEAATGLLDIRRAATVLFNELLPRLLTIDPGSTQFEDILDEIAEEYRHIHYHISNTRLFNYVVPPA